MNSERDHLLGQIATIKTLENDFSIHNMRWANAKIEVNGTPTDIREVNFSELSPADLVYAFRRIVVRVSRQM